MSLKDSYNNPVFLMGCERSGTTLLRAMLTCHPNIALPYEASRFTEMFDSEAVWDKTWDLEGVRKVADTFLADSFVSQWGLNREQVLANLEEKGKTDYRLRDVIRAAYMTHALGCGKPRWGDKTPRNAYDMKWLVREFPKAQFIHIVRDGRDVYESWKKVDWTRTHWKEFNVKVAAKTWKLWTWEIEKYGKQLPAGRYLRLRYEELISEPEASIRKILNFLDEPYSEKCLEYYKKKSFVPADQQNSIHALLSARPDLTRLYGWKKKMTESEKLEFESIAGPVLYKYGYEYRPVFETYASKDWMIQHIQKLKEFTGQRGEKTKRGKAVSGHSKKQTIGYVLIGKALGGNGKYVLNLIKNLDHNVYEPVCYLNVPSDKDRDQFVSQLRKAGCRVVSIIKDGTGEESAEKEAQVIEDVKAVSENQNADKNNKKPDGLVQIARSFVYNFNLMRRQSRFLKAQKLDVIHFSFGMFPEYLPMIAAADRAGIKRIISTVHILEQRPVMKSRVAAWIYRKAVKAVDVMIVLGKKPKERLIREYDIPAEKIHIVHNGVEVQETAMPGEKSHVRRDLGISGDEIFVLVPARLSKEKGHECLFDAVTRLVSPEKFRFVLAGDGPLKDELQDKANKAGISKYILFAGYRSDIEDLVRASDLIMLTSHNEGFPFALLEGMAEQKPVISTDVGAVADMIVHNVTGKILRQNDSEAVAEALNEFAASSPEARQEMGLKGRERLRSLFNIESMTENTYVQYA